MKSEDKDTIQYKARVFKDNAIIPQVEEELRILVDVVLGSKRTLKIEYYKDHPNSNGEVNKYDPYPSCKNWQKKYCRSKPTEYCGNIPELGYIFYGNNRVEIYCDVIKTFIGNRIIVPFSY